MNRGFTLIEVLVALGIGGIVLLAAVGLTSGLGDIGGRIVRSSAEWDRQANAERWLLRLVADAEPGIGEQPGVIGDSRAARFASWCDAQGGWKVRCDVEIEFVVDTAGDALVVRAGAAEPVRLRSGLAAGRILYLATLGGRDWADSWQSIVMPVALGFDTGTDTLVAPIGDRG